MWVLPSLMQPVTVVVAVVVVVWGVVVVAAAAAVLLLPLYVSLHRLRIGQVH